MNMQKCNMCGDLHDCERDGKLTDLCEGCLERLSKPPETTATLEAFLIDCRDRSRVRCAQHVAIAQAEMDKGLEGADSVTLTEAVRIAVAEKMTAVAFGYMVNDLKGEDDEADGKSALDEGLAGA